MKFAAQIAFLMESGTKQGQGRGREGRRENPRRGGYSASARLFVAKEAVRSHLAALAPGMGSWSREPSGSPQGTLSRALVGLRQRKAAAAAWCPPFPPSVVFSSEAKSTATILGCSRMPPGPGICGRRNFLALSQSMSLKSRRDHPLLKEA